MLRSDRTNGIAESSSQIFKLEKRTYVFITQKQGCKTENEPFENGADVIGESLIIELPRSRRNVYRMNEPSAAET